MHVCILTNWEASKIPAQHSKHPAGACVSALVALPRVQRKQKGVFCAGSIESLTPTLSVSQVMAEEHGVHAWELGGSMDDLPALGALYSATDSTLPDECLLLNS